MAGATMAEPLESFTDPLGIEFVRLPGGTFRMGHPSFPLCFPVHEVELDAFWISRHEITNEQYDAFRVRPRFPESPGASHPATRITWYDTQDFCDWLTKRNGRTIRLPTEAEWEYAARGGLEGRDYPWGNEEPDGRATFGQLITTPVGTYPANGFGLFDMAGNVGEWVSDWTDPSDELPNGASRYYAEGPRKNPQGLAEGAWKVWRGGTYNTYDLYCYERCVGDLGEGPIPAMGFRVVMEDVPSRQPGTPQGP
jgi:formylglycine-generating enzyme